MGRKVRADAARVPHPDPLIQCEETAEANDRG